MIFYLPKKVVKKWRKFLKLKISENNIDIRFDFLTKSDIIQERIEKYFMELY